MISENVLLALLKPSDTRTNQDIDVIANFCRLFPVFNEIQECVFRPFCRIIGVEEFEPDAEIYSEGDVGSDWFVIIDGHVKVTTGANSVESHHSTLRIGDEFGRNARSSDVRRTETVTALEHTYVIKVNRRQWQEVNSAISSGADADTQGFAIEFIQNLCPLPGMNLATSIERKTFPTNAVVVHQNEESDGVFYILHGSASVVREIEFKENRTKTTKLVEIDELGVGSVIGIRSLSLNQTENVSIVARSELTAYFLSRSDFFRKVDIKRQREHLPPDYPEDSKIRKLFREKMEWERYKKQVVREVIQHKKAKRELNLQY